MDETTLPMPGMLVPFTVAWLAQPIKPELGLVVRRGRGRWNVNLDLDLLVVLASGTARLLTLTCHPALASKGWHVIQDPEKMVRWDA